MHLRGWLGIGRCALPCALSCLTNTAAGAVCPTDAAPRPEAVLLTIQLPGKSVLSLTAADFSALPQTRLTQKQTVSSASAGASAGANASASASTPASERSLVYSGVLLRDALQRAGYGGPDDRGARATFIEAVATDNYRSIFSWGELFNSANGDQALVISTQDDKPLDAYAGPLALRSLADLRPGPRHVRNLCALVVRQP